MAHPDVCGSMRTTPTIKTGVLLLHILLESNRNYGFFTNIAVLLRTLVIGAWVECAACRSCLALLFYMFSRNLYEHTKLDGCIHYILGTTITQARARKPPTNTYYNPGLCQASSKACYLFRSRYTFYSYLAAPLPATTHSIITRIILVCFYAGT